MIFTQKSIDLQYSEHKYYITMVFTQKLMGLQYLKCKYYTTMIFTYTKFNKVVNGFTVFKNTNNYTNMIFTQK